MRGEWIEITGKSKFRDYAESLPMRGEWIEIFGSGLGGFAGAVSPHAGRVD